MAESSPRDVAHPGHNPFDDPRPKKNKGLTVALLVALVVHAALAVYLSGDMARSINGAIISIDGGWTAA